MTKEYYVKDVIKNSKKKLFTFMDMFAGGGGSSTGFKLAGGHCLYFNEFVEEAAKTHLANYPGVPYSPEDIKNLTGEMILNESEISAGDLDILAGSPPCSAFSVAGKRGKNWKGAVDDTRNSHIDMETGEVVHEGTLYEVKSGVKDYSVGKSIEAVEDLFMEFIRVAKDIQSKVIIAENVKGITMGEAKAKLFEFINAFEKIGYYVSYRVLSSADFGVPQARERTIFICIREDVADEIGMSFMNIESVFPTQTHFPLKKTVAVGMQEYYKDKKHITIKEAIDDIDNDPEEVQMLLDFVQGNFQKKFVELLPFNPTRHTKPSDKEFRDKNPKGSCFNMIRPNPNKPSPTITQIGSQRQLGGGVYHYNANRKLTIKELMVLMGMPVDFKLTGTFDNKAERLGRMVTPPMMEAIAKSIYEKILEPYYAKLK